MDTRLRLPELSSIPLHKLVCGGSACLPTAELRNYGPGDPRRFFQTKNRQKLIQHLVRRQARGDRYWLRSLDVNSYDRSFSICNVGFELNRRIAQGPIRRFGGKGALDASTFGIAVWNIGDGERR